MNITEKIINLRKPKTDIPVLKPISDRFSPRVFSGAPISDNEIAIMLEAARLAPSGRNHQPWFYIYARKGTEGHKRICSCFPERNHIWASKAPLLVAAVYDPKDAIDGLNEWAQYDLGQASMAMVLQAQSLDIYCRQIGSFDRSKFKEEFASYLSDNEPLVILAFGHIGGDEEYSNTTQEIVDKDMTEWEFQNKNQRKGTIGVELK
jgi:nitroreductase